MTLPRQRTFQFGNDDHASPAGDPASSLDAALGDAIPEDLRDQTVYVVDAFALMFQVFHALPEMTSPQGRPVGCVFGFLRDLLHLIEDRKPDHLFVAFDMPGDTFRHTLYAAYKADRGEMPEALRAQIPDVKRMIAALGIPMLGVPAYEADDLMATLARRVERGGGTCLLVTNDKDCRQLISEKVGIYLIRKQQVYGAAELREEWGIRPDQVVDFQALVGDPVDNVPGVPLIGPKIAGQWLQQFDTLENLYEHLPEIPGGKRKQNLVDHRQAVLLSRQLVRLADDMPLRIDWTASRPGHLQHVELTALCREFGFRSYSEKFGKLSLPTATPEAPRAIRVIRDATEVARLLETWLQQDSLAIWVQGSDPRPCWSTLRGIGVVWNQPVESVYLAFDALQNSATNPFVQALAPLWRSPTIRFVGHDLKSAWVQLRSLGMEPQGSMFDTLVAAYLLDAGSRNYSLAELCRRYLGDDLAAAESAELPLSNDPEDALRIAHTLRQLEAAWRLAPVLAEALNQALLATVMADLEMPLVPVLARMESRGVRIDTNRLGELQQDFSSRLAILETKIYDLAGETFNINAPKQLGRILFEKLGLPVIKSTKSGPSTDAEVLEELAKLHDLPRTVIRYRQFAKLLSTYVTSLPTMICPTTGRVHTHLSQVVAATGRLSSAEPNLQNIPTRTEEGHEIRSAFVAGRDDWKLLSADYSQIELRVLAHFSQDASLLQAFHADEDIHTRVASEVFGVPQDQVTSAMRRTAKAVNFGVVYGQSAFGLGKALGIEKGEAASFIERYFAQYAGMAEYMEELLDACRRDGYVRTISGRRRAVSGVRDRSERDWRQRNLPERTAVNSVIQGSAADLIKQAMIDIERAFKESRGEARLLLQIHDELLFELPESEVAAKCDEIKRCMESVALLRVPLRVDLKVGSNWAHCHPVLDAV